MEEKELFEEYEVRNWDITPRIYKILGIATLINFLVIFAFAQFNLLNKKGCDTPFFGVVCQALDSAYIATTFMGKGFESERIDYIPTEIGEDEVVTIINVGDRLEYPEGYFALANPDQFNQNEDLGVIPSPTDSPISTNPSTSEDLTKKAQVLPTPNDVGDQKVPDSLINIEDGNSKPNKTPVVKNPQRRVKNPSDASPGKLPKLDGKVATTETPQPTPTDEELNKVKEDFNKGFNKKPLQDFADGVIAKLESEKPEDKVDLMKSFKVVLDGTLTKEGKFDAKKTKFVGKSEGDEQMINVAKDAIEAIGDSAIFSYLVTLGVDKVNITLVQDDKEISAVITSNLPNPEKAKTVSSGFNGLIVLANINTKDDKDVQALLKATKFSAEGKSFVINFTMPKDDAHKLIDQKLQEARQKKLQNNNEAAKNQSNQGK